MKNRFKGIGVWLALILAVYIIYSIVVNFVSTTTEMDYSDFVRAVQKQQVSTITVTGNDVTAEFVDGKNATVEIPSLEIMQEDIGKEINEQMSNGTLKQVAHESNISWLAISNILSTVIIIAFMVILLGKRGGGGFTKSTARLVYDKPEITFKSMAGADEAKRELEEVVEFLKNPDKFTALGARIPKGVLLVGSPGTGKTLLAKAVAGEADVPFFTMSGSNFVELYVGVGASRVRDLFSQAKKCKPCIVFIDEIDAVGRQRGTGLGGGNDEREQTLNQLLVEMDGFGDNDGIIIIAATNRPDVLDPALLRPGRFDRQVVVDMPDLAGREAILKVHSKNKPLAPEVDLLEIARATIGYSGANLENLMNEAAILAANRNHTMITRHDIEDANLKVMIGAEVRSKAISDKEKKLTAYHEAGHAVITRLISDDTHVHKVSIMPRGRAGGFTLSVPEEDKKYTSKNEMLIRIMELLGGRAAEDLTLDDISTGASNDIQRATEIARHMVVKYGMSDIIGPVSYDDGGEVFIGRDFAQSKPYSEKTAAEIDSEVKNILTTQYEKTKQILTDNMAVLTKVAKKLIDKETIDNAEFEECFNISEGGNENAGN
ncbi:MAG: ATP-dependent zinc metalloprotease FtsH [Oscillospiraceae bacterium]|nr:ATP-dependent zinc metalloprotease FtsH [Oscillospiraceae bacterium]